MSFTTLLLIWLQFVSAHLTERVRDTFIIEKLSSFVVSLELRPESSAQLTSQLLNDPSVTEYLSSGEQTKRFVGRVNAACFTAKHVLGNRAILNPQAIRIEVERSW